MDKDRFGEYKENSHIEMMINKRLEVKVQKDYASADAIRNELLEMGGLIDTKEGTKFVMKNI